mgnify:CR=1 FL=1|jgi:hypothetical protein
MDDINTLFLCSICLEQIEGQIFQCNNGHISCGICKNQIKHCATCRSNNFQIRNLLLENIRDNNVLNQNQNKSINDLDNNNLNKNEYKCKTINNSDHTYKNIFDNYQINSKLWNI